MPKLIFVNNSTITSKSFNKFYCANTGQIPDQHTEPEKGNTVSSKTMNVYQVNFDH